MANKTKVEDFRKKSTNKNNKTIIRRMVQEEEFELSLEEIERMERNANAQIDMANQLIVDMQAKLAQCVELRKLL